MNRGMMLALVLIAAGLAAGVWSVFALHGQMHRILQAFTPATAEMIGHAPQVQLLQLVPDTTTAADHAELIGIGDKTYRVANKKEVETAAGFTYLRNALLNDASYDWDQPVEGAQRNWQYILDFADGPSHFPFAFDLSSPCMMKLEGGKTVSIRPISAGVQAFFGEQFPQSEKAAAKSE